MEKALYSVLMLHYVESAFVLTQYNESIPKLKKNMKLTKHSITKQL